MGRLDALMLVTVDVETSFIRVELSLPEYTIGTDLAEAFDTLDTAAAAVALHDGAGLEGEDWLVGLEHLHGTSALVATTPVTRGVAERESLRFFGLHEEELQ